MKFQTLASGSEGNCSLLSTQSANVLIDLGVPLAYLEECLAARGLKPQKIDAVFVTHGHNDHISGLEAFCKKYSAKVFIHKNAFVETAKKLYYTNHTLTYFDAPFEFKGLKVSFFRCPHDTAFCCAYRFDDGNAAAASVTDLGNADDKLVQFVTGCGLVLLESNYDEEMLKKGDYPYPLKCRIAGPNGHLSNVQAAKLAVKMAQAGVRHILLGHMSRNNNTPETAFYTTVQALKNSGFAEGRDVVVDVVAQYNKSGVFDVG